MRTRRTGNLIRTVATAIVLVVSPCSLHAGDANGPPIVVRQVLPSAVVQGQAFTAEVYVTNTGPHTLDDVRLTGQWSTGFRLTVSSPASPSTESRAEWTLGKLAPGEARQIRLGFAAADQIAGNEFRSEFEASFRGARTDVQSVPIQRAVVDLAVTGPQVALVGQPVKVHVALKNPGTSEVRGVTLTSRLPDGLTHPSGSDLEADVGVLPAGHTEAVPLMLTPTKAGPVRAVFKVAGTGMQSVEREVNIVALDAKIEFDLTGPKRLPQSWPGTYEMTVHNAGSQAAPGVQLDVAVPPGFDEQNLRATEGAKFDPAARKLVWDFGELKPGETRTVVWLGVAAKAGEHSVSASVRLGGSVAKTTEWRTHVQPSSGR